MRIKGFLTSFSSVILLCFLQTGAKAQWYQSNAALYGLEADDSYGQAVAISADGLVCAVGAPNKAGVREDAKGEVRVYAREDISDDWTLREKLSSTFAYPRERFGTQVMLSEDGGILSILLSSEDGPNGFRTVQTYEWVDDEYTRREGPTPVREDYQSFSISNDGNELMISHFYGFDFFTLSVEEKEWEPVRLPIDVRGTELILEAKMSADGQYLIYSSNNEFNETYTTEVFERGSSEWESLFKIEGEDGWYSQLSINADGTQFAGIHSKNNDTLSVFSKKGDSYEVTQEITLDKGTNWSTKGTVFSPEGDYLALSGYLFERGDYVDVYDLSTTKPTLYGTVGIRHLVEDTANMGNLNTGFGADFALGKDAQTLMIGAPQFMDSTNTKTGAAFSYGFSIRSSLAEGTGLEGFAAYPNPTQDILRVRLPNNNNVPYQLKSLNGAIIRSGSLSNGSVIDISGLEPNIYLLQTGHKVQRIIKL